MATENNFAFSRLRAKTECWVHVDFPLTTKVLIKVIMNLQCSESFSGGGHSHMSADIMYYDLLFTQILHPMTLFFTTVHTQSPVFSKF